MRKELEEMRGEGKTARRRSDSFHARMQEWPAAVVGYFVSMQGVRRPTTTTNTMLLLLCYYSTTNYYHHY